VPPEIESYEKHSTPPSCGAKDHLIAPDAMYSEVEYRSKQFLPLAILYFDLQSVVRVIEDTLLSIKILLYYQYSTFFNNLDPTDIPYS
jgi:hypothetical protein